MVPKPIQISQHAVERMKERLECVPSKYAKLAKKAWDSKLPVDPRDIPNNFVYRGRNRKAIRYRLLMGQIYVFAEQRDSIVLITLYPPTRKLARKRPKVFGS